MGLRGSYYPYMGSNYKLLVRGRQTPHSKGFWTLIPTVTFKKSKSWNLTPFDTKKGSNYKLIVRGRQAPYSKGLFLTYTSDWHVCAVYGFGMNWPIIGLNHCFVIYEPFAIYRPLSIWEREKMKGGRPHIRKDYFLRTRRIDMFVPSTDSVWMCL